MMMGYRLGLQCFLLATLLESIVGSKGLALESNMSPDPYANYGLCGSSSGIKDKAHHLFEAGQENDLVDVLAISVIECRGYDGGGHAFPMDCPAESPPFAYCVKNDNDGQGNHIQLGVLKLDNTTNPNSKYAGCHHEGAKLQSNLDLVRASGYGDPRMIKGIVTLSCNPSSSSPQATAIPATEVECPSVSSFGAQLYDYCLRTSQDGLGNDVTIGVVKARDPGDPHGLYGECVSAGVMDTYGISSGFAPKSSLVREMGRSMTNVRSITMIDCSAPNGMGLGHLTGHRLKLGLCSLCDTLGPSRPVFVGLYNYCIWGTDSFGNGVIVGVNGGGLEHMEPTPDVVSVTASDKNGSLEGRLSVLEERVSRLEESCLDEE